MNINKKEKFIKVLNNHFGSYNIFPEVANISDEDFIKIIELYEQKASIGGKDPWNYLYFDELIIMQQCLYEVIKNNYRYSDITAKVEVLFEQELNRRLQMPVYSFGEKTDETYRASYAEMPEYAMTLADMCTRYVYEQQKSYVEDSILPSIKVESRISTYEAVKSDFAKINKQMPESQDQIVSQAKVMVVRASEERKANFERESQQREIELINIQQEIIKMENERLEIEKRIKTISSETLGSYYSKQVSQRYPEEYQRFQEHKDQIKNHSSNQSSIHDIKARFNKVSEDLQFYKGVLPIYENFYQKFEEMKREHQQQKTNFSQEQGPIITPVSITNQPEIKQQKLLNVNLSDEVKQRISQYIKKQIKMIYVKNIDVNKIYQEGNYIIVEAKDNLGHSFKKEFETNDFFRLFNQPSSEFKSIESIQPTQEQFQRVSQEESTIIVEEQQKQIKSKIIDQIIAGMNSSGELSFGGISISERMNIMQNIQSRLDAKSMDELQILLSTYQNQNAQEETMNSGMHR